VNTEQLILSVGTILLAARALGWIFQRIGQPRVVGEMTAGIILGPSLFGRFFPGAFAHIFPLSSLPVLTALSQLGLLLFMFVVGLEVDLQRILKQRTAVVLISNVSIMLPLALGIGLATVLYPQYAGSQVPFSSFALFMGTAMSVTAFPVLARILKERNLLGTDLGATAISCAAIDDVSAWLLLAVLTATVHSAQSWHHLAITLLLLVAFVAIMLFPVRRLAASLELLYRKHGAGVELLSLLILIIFVASYTTERLGVHALFGAFVAGLVMPKSGPMIAALVERIESLSLALLLPLFFAVTGLRTRIDLLTDRTLWGRPHSQGHWDAMEGLTRPGSPDEHPRASRTGGPERRPGSGCPLASPVHHDGTHGAGHDFHDHSDPDRHEGSPSRVVKSALSHQLSIR
jgi:Kef-type K+ transport system membrane component KefB